MALLSDIIFAAYRESNLISINADPTDNETAEALDRLNALILATLGNECGGELADINIRGQFDQSSLVDQFIPENVRLVLNLTSNLSFDLHPQPYDGQRFAVVDGDNSVGAYTITLDANGRKIEGAATQT